MTTVMTSYWPADVSEPVLETTVGGILRAAAAQAPDLTAMVAGVPDPAARRRWTYAQLLAEAEQAARALTVRFAPGERVAVWAPNLPEWVILEYAAGLAGLVLVTVNPALRPAELAYVLNQSGAAGIFLIAEFRSPMAQFLDEVRPDVPSLREVVYFTDWTEFLATAPDQAVLPEVTPDDIAQIQYTSGTTGQPNRGCLRIEGRIKDMIIRGGENIYPREIEDALFAHPAVAEAVVIGVPDETWGEVIAAFVRPVPGPPAPAPEELRAWCRERLAPYKTPRHWVFVEAFPMTPSGKIQKFKLRESFIEPQPG